jgi:hypothetical protein
MMRKIQQDQKVDIETLKRRARKGIPDSIRGSAWPILTQSDRVIPSNYGWGTAAKQEWMKIFLNQGLTKKELHSIFKDITRTLPTHVWFAEDLGTG